MKFTKIPETGFEEIQMNAGVLLDDFNPETGVLGNIIGATTGGNNFTATPSYSDYGEDIDNCPKNVKELKILESWDIKSSGTFVTVTNELAKFLVGAGDFEEGNTTHIIPRKDIKDADFTDLWWVGDYSKENGEEDGGFCAIHMMNTLSTGGFQIQSSDKGKGNFSYEFTAHFSMKEQDLVPYEIFIKSGGKKSDAENSSLDGEV